MTNIYIKHGLRFLILVLLQVLVLNKVSINGFLIPYVYLLFILLLPFDTNKNYVLILGFFTGLTIDFFGNSLGLHAAATTLLAFARPVVLNFLFPKMEFLPHEEPNIGKLGLSGFLKYVFILVLINHLALIFLEVFNLHYFLSELLQVFLNAFFTTFSIIVLVILFSRNRIRYKR